MATLHVSDSHELDIGCAVSMPYDAPLSEGNTSGSAEGSMLPQGIDGTVYLILLTGGYLLMEGLLNFVWLCCLLMEILPNRGGYKILILMISFRGGLSSAWFALSMLKLRVYADNEKVRALIQKIKDQYARADKVLRRTR